MSLQAQRAWLSLSLYDFVRDGFVSLAMTYYLLRLHQQSRVLLIFNLF